MCIADNRHQGFTIVEIIVAMVIVALVAVGLVTTMASASNAQIKAKVLAQQTSVSEAAYDRLAGDTEWARSAAFGCNTMPLDQFKVACNDNIRNVAFPASAESRLPDDIDGELVRDAKVVGIDDAGDGRGGSDSDGVRPDFYEVTLTVAAPERLNTKVQVMRGVVNPSARASGGSIMVQACVVSEQYDERLPIGGCPTPVLGRNFLAPPAVFDESLIILTSVLGNADQGWRAQYGIRSQNNLRLEVEPIEDTPAIDPSRVSARRANGDLMSCTFPSGKVVCMTSQLPAKSLPPHQDTGAISSSTQISGLTPGMYSVRVVPPTGKETWKEKSVPAGDRVNVQAGTRNRVLQVLRPTATRSIRFRLQTTLTTYVRDTDDDGNPIRKVSSSVVVPYLHRDVGSTNASLLPAPSGRVRVTPGTGAPQYGTVGIGTASEGASTITVGGLPPGIYFPHVWTSATGLFQAPTGGDARFGKPGIPYIYVAEPGARDETNLPANDAGTLHFSLCYPRGDDFLCPGGGGGGGGGSPSSGGGA